MSIFFNMSFEIKLNELILNHQVELKRQITISEISEATEISRPQLSKLRTNPNENTTIKTIERLCIFFDCSLDDILEFNPPLKSNKRG